MGLKENYEHEIDIYQICKAVLSKGRKIIFVGVLVSILIAAFGFMKADTSLFNDTKITYEPTTEYVGIARIFLGSDTDEVTSQAIRDYLLSNDVITSTLDLVDEEIDLNTFRSMISFTNSTNVSIMIFITGYDKDMIMKITEAYVNTSVEKIRIGFKKEEASILEAAYMGERKVDKEISKTIISYKKIIQTLVKYILVGFILGVFIMVGIYLYLFMIDLSLHDSRDVNGYLGLPVIGTIPMIKGSKKNIRKGKTKKYLRLSQYTSN